MEILTHKNILNNICLQKKELYIHIKNIGFTFLLGKRRKHNLISPIFLTFFKIGKQEYLLLNNNIGEVSTKPENNSYLPFLPAYINSISLEDTFHYVGKKVVWCSDNKFRECKAVKFNFEHEEHPYSDIFYIDKSLREHCAILASTFWSNFNAE